MTNTMTNTTTSTMTSTTPACPSRFRIAAGALPPDVAEHARACPRCAEALAELAQARAELLGPDPAARSLAAARGILAEVERRRRASRQRWLRFLPVALVPAAAAAVLVLAPVQRPGPGERAGAVDEGAAPPAAGVRAKGALVVDAYCQRGDRVFAVEQGADFLAGDRLRFAYTTPAPGHLLVFAVDDTGALFPYYRDDALGAVPVAAGARVMLPGSIELDHHRGWERVFLLWSARAIDPQAVRAAVRAALAQAAGDVRRADRLAVDGAQASFLLRRP
jgi:predicted ribosome-associated RNA-binding protein Tma20